MKNTIKKMGTMALALFLLTLASCSKYEEGPGISLRSKKSRLVGDWEMTSITTNGIESTTMVESDFFDCISGTTIAYDITTKVEKLSYSIKEDGSWSSAGDVNFTYLDFVTAYSNCTETYTNGTESYTENGTWEFSDDKESIILTYADNSKETWKIIELREKHLQIELTQGSEITRLIMESK